MLVMIQVLSTLVLLTLTLSQAQDSITADSATVVNDTTVLEGAAGNVGGFNEKSEYAGLFVDRGRKSPYIDTVVIGGGIAGTYSMWRILKHWQRNGSNFEDIALFERSDRIGGRLYSPTIGNCPLAKNKPRCELGGMRIRNTDGILTSLVEELGIETTDFRLQENPQSSKDSPQNPVWMRGTAFSRQVVQELLQNNNEPIPGVSDVPLPYALGQYNASASNVLDKSFEELKYVDVVIPVPNATLPVGVEYDPCNGEVNAQLLDLFLGSDGALEIFGDTSEDYRVWQPSIAQASSIFGSTTESMDLTYAASGYPTFAAMGLGTQDGYAEKLLASVQGNSEGGTGVGGGVQYYRRPLYGMQSIPLTLEKRIKLLADNNEQNVFKNYELLSVERVATSKCRDYERFRQDTTAFDPPSKPGAKKLCYELIIEETKTNTCTEVTSGTGKYYKVYTSRVILAVPREAVETISFKTSSDSVDSFDIGTGLTEVPGYHGLLKQVVGVPLIKIFLEFPERFWETTGIQNEGRFFNFSVGRATSSSMLSNIFAWYPGTQTNVDEGDYSCLNDGKGGIMQLYLTITEAASFLNPYYPQEREGCSDGDLTMNDFGDRDCSNCFKGTQMFDASAHVTQIFKRQIMRELQGVFGRKDLPEPRKIRYTVWDGRSAQTQCDAVNFWVGGIRWWDLYNSYLNFLGDDNSIHVIGTAFSYNQGWAEGALETAEHLLHEIGGLPLPEWLSRKDFCSSNPFFQTPNDKSATQDEQVVRSSLYGDDDGTSGGSAKLTEQVKANDSEKGENPAEVQSSRGARGGQFTPPSTSRRLGEAEDWVKGLWKKAGLDL